MFRDADNERHFSLYSFHDGVSSRRSRYENDGSIGPGCNDSIADRIEYRNRLHQLACFSRRYTGDDIRAEFSHLLCMETGSLACDALYNDLRILINQNRHFTLPPLLLFLQKQPVLPALLQPFHVLPAP